MTGVPASAAGGSGAAGAAGAADAQGTNAATADGASVTEGAGASTRRGGAASARGIGSAAGRASGGDPVSGKGASAEGSASDAASVDRPASAEPPAPAHGIGSAPGGDSVPAERAPGDGAPPGAAPVEGPVPAGQPATPREAGAASAQEGGVAGSSGTQDTARSVRGGKLGAAAVNQASVWNVANLLTMLRLLLVPGFVVLMLAEGGYDPVMRAWAWAAFAVAMITDVFDGHLARTYNLVTDFGKIADPIADKAIMGAALICLSGLGDLPWWVTGVILGRELGITLLRFVVIRYGVIPASRGGKLKTLTQGIAVGMYVLVLTGPLATLRFWMMAVALVLTVVTGLDYVRQAVVLRRQGIAERRAALKGAEQ